jgi:enamine deaminase RidA (YjgF/YER057c/UK114 family)
LYERILKQKGILLPEAPKPIGTYLPASRSGNILYISGMIPKISKKSSPKGKIGRELTAIEGYEASRLCALNALAVIRYELGSLDKVNRVLKLVGYVASAESFVDQPFVVNGASDLLVDIFGEMGKHARVSVGVAELPGNVPIEIEIIIEIKNSDESIDNDDDNT